MGRHSGAGSPNETGLSGRARGAATRHAGVVSLITTVTPGAPLAAGTPAPDFALRCSQHCAATLDDYRGRPLVLAFYVADWHPVCTGQLERFRDSDPDLERLGADLVAISADTLWSHAAFARAHRLTFPLLSDDAPRGAIARTYGVYDAQKELPRRALFVVDAAGTIAWSACFPESLDPGIDGVLTALEALAGTDGQV